MTENENKNELNNFEKLFDEEMMRVDKKAMTNTAESLYSFYESLIGAGFGSDQAFALVTSVVLSTVGGIRSK